MFERFTDRARRIIILAQEEARLLRHDHISTGHIVLGFIALGEEAKDKPPIPIPAQVLKELGYTRESVTSFLLPKGEFNPSGHIPFVEEAKKALELSLREALQLGANYIATEHLLLGLIRVANSSSESECAAMFGMDISELRQRTIEKLIEKTHSPEPDTLDSRPPPPPPAPKPSAAPLRALTDDEAMRAGVSIIDRLPPERRKAVMKYLREYAKRTSE